MADFSSMVVWCMLIRTHSVALRICVQLHCQTTQWPGSGNDKGSCVEFGLGKRRTMSAYSCAWSVRRSCDSPSVHLPCHGRMISFTVQENLRVLIVMLPGFRIALKPWYRWLNSLLKFQRIQVRWIQHHPSLDFTSKGETSQRPTAWNVGTGLGPQHFNLVFARGESHGTALFSDHKVAIEFSRPTSRPCSVPCSKFLKISGGIAFQIQSF